MVTNSSYVDGNNLDSFRIILESFRSFSFRAQTTDAQWGNRLYCTVKSQSQIFRYRRSILAKNVRFRWSMPSLGVRSPCFRGPLLHKPVTGQELFFAVSYSKLALSSCLGVAQISEDSVLQDLNQSQKNSCSFLLRVIWYELMRK